MVHTPHPSAEPEPNTDAVAATSTAQAGQDRVRAPDLAGLGLDVARPLVIVDVDEVLGHFMEGFGAFLKRSHLDTGKLALYLAKHRQPLKMAKMMVALVLGTWQRDAELEVMSLTEFTVKSRRRTLKVANDGEVHRMEAPLHYRMLAGGLRILVPAENAEAAPAEVEDKPAEAPADPRRASA